MRSFELKMHQKPFGGRAPPGPAGGAHSAYPDHLAVLRGPPREGVWKGQGGRKGGGEKRGRGKRNGKVEEGGEN
jgi:hypothetical protein